MEELLESLDLEKSSYHMGLSRVSKKGQGRIRQTSISSWEVIPTSQEKEYVIPKLEFVRQSKAFLVRRGECFRSFPTCKELISEGLTA